jgi:hypothetical protein
MPCPAESRTLDEYSSAAPRYDSRQKSGLRKKLKEIGVRVYEAVSIGNKKEKDVYIQSLPLEEAIAGSLHNSILSDSAWGCKCEKYECPCVTFCGSDDEYTCKCQGDGKPSSCEYVHSSKNYP